MERNQQKRNRNLDETDKKFKQVNMSSLKKQLTSFDYPEDNNEEVEDYANECQTKKSSALYDSLVIIDDISNDLTGILSAIDARVEVLTIQVGVHKEQSKLLAGDSGNNGVIKDLNLNDIAKRLAQLASYARNINEDLAKIV